MTAGELIKEARLKKRLTLQNVADSLGMDISTISKIEKGTRTLKQEHIKKLSKLLDIPVSQIQSIYLTDSIVKQYGDNPYILDALKRASTIIKQIR